MKKILTIITILLILLHPVSVSARAGGGGSSSGGSSMTHRSRARLSNPLTVPISFDLF